LTSSAQAPYRSLPAKAESSFAPLRLLSETKPSFRFGQGRGTTRHLTWPIGLELCRHHRSFPHLANCFTLFLERLLPF